MHPKHPIDLAASLKAPVLGLYGGADTGIPVASIDKMRDALKQSKHDSEIIVYPDTPHGFNADYRPTLSQGAKPKTAGSGCWRGSRSTAWRERHAPQDDWVAQTTRLSGFRRDKRGSALGVIPAARTSLLLLRNTDNKLSVLTIHFTPQPKAIAALTTPAGASVLQG